MASVLSKDATFQNYEVSAVNGTDSVSGLDTGTILGTVPPGKAGLKLTDGTRQSATKLACDSTSGVDGNFTQDPAYQGQAAGYSLLGE